MPDRFLQSNASGGDGHGRETRILRDRLGAHEDRLDTCGSEAVAFSSARLLVQVYNGGAMPSAAEKVYFTHPVLVIGAETEGGAGTFSVDTTTTVPVVMLGGIPSVGDYLIAYSVGGRWVAEKLGCQVKIHVTCSGTALVGDRVTITAGGPTIATGTTDGSGNVALSLPKPLTNPYLITITGNSKATFTTTQNLSCGSSYTFDVCAGSGESCTPCNIPQSDLTISWTNLLDGDGSATMTYSGGGPATWSTGCEDNGLEFSLSCTESGIELRAFFFISGVCPTGETNYCSNLRAVPLGLNLTDFTCSPFVLTFAVPAIDCPAIYSLGNTQFVITL